MFGFNGFNYNYNKDTSPVKCIYNYSNPMNNSSYANAVLQSLTSLECIKQWYYRIRNNFIKINNNPNSITPLFYNILYFLYTGNYPDSLAIINQYFQNVWQFYKKQPKLDPFHFLFYFLQLFHSENNIISNPYFNVSAYEHPHPNNLLNDQYMLTLYINYFKATQNSIVSNYFFNAYKHVIKCPNQLLNCPNLYHYNSKSIIQFNVDDAKKHRDLNNPLRAGTKINLEDCFKCCQKGERTRCSNCGCYHAVSVSSLWYSNKVLIFSFNRAYHSFQGDIDFGTRIDMSQYCKSNMHGPSRNIYNLTACVSAYNFNKYFADIRINGYWFRFMNQQFKTLDNNRNEIFSFEPQLLFYELEQP